MTSESPREQASLRARIAEAARRLGVQPPAVERARELAILADDDALVALSGRFPTSEFVIANSALLAAGGALGRFEFIRVEQPLSERTPSGRRDLLRVVHDLLAPSGLALLSYGVGPGLHLPQLLREPLQFHVGTRRGKEALDACRELLALLARTTAGGRGVEDLRPHLDQALQASDEDLWRDFIAAPAHDPLFPELAEELAGADLRYLGELDEAPKVEELSALDDPLRLEQYLDWGLMRSQRRSLVARADPG